MMNSSLKSRINPNLPQNNKSNKPKFKFEGPVTIRHQELGKKIGRGAAECFGSICYRTFNTPDGYGLIDEVGDTCVFDSMRKWAKRVGVSISSIKRHFKKLIENGLIKARLYIDENSYRHTMVKPCLDAFNRMMGYTKNEESGGETNPVDKPVEKPFIKEIEWLNLNPLVVQSEPHIYNDSNSNSISSSYSSTSENSSSDQISNPPSAADGASDSSILPLESDLEYAEIADLDEISEEEERFIACMMETEEASRETVGTELEATLDPEHKKQEPRRFDSKSFKPKFSKHMSHNEKIAHWQETLFPSNKQTAKKISSSMPITTPGSSEHSSLLDKWRKVLCPS